ncbi:MAG: hypothetical protein ABF839_06900 [Acetobacter orientalis]|uniref:hypothetical protein n=1 Tax=Acetobacter orientalis TaxID=146474 RepID=UPI0039E97BC0
MNWTSLVTFDVPTLTLSSIIGAGFSGAVWLLKTHSEKKITAKIEHEFNRKLEDHKSALKQNFEVFKTVTSQIQDRRTRSNEKEYNACIECWTALYEAYSAVLCTYSSLILPSGFNTSSDETIRQVLEANDFLDIEIQEIIAASDKEQKYVQFVRQKNLILAQEKIKYSKQILSINNIFFGKELYNKFFSFVDLMNSVWSEQFYIFSTPKIPFSSPKTMNFQADGKKNLDEIMEILRTNLYIRAINDPLEHSPSGVVTASPAPQPSSSGNTPEPEPIAPK